MCSYIKFCLFCFNCVITVSSVGSVWIMFLLCPCIVGMHSHKQCVGEDATRLWNHVSATVQQQWICAHNMSNDLLSFLREASFSWHRFKIISPRSFLNNVAWITILHWCQHHALSIPKFYTRRQSKHWLSTSIKSTQLNHIITILNVHSDPRDGHRPGLPC